jgi:hypothetical protein
MKEGEPETCKQAKKHQKSDRLLPPGKKKIMKNIQPRSRRPSDPPDRRYEAVGDIQKKLFSHPLAPLLQPLGMA